MIFLRRIDKSTQSFLTSGEREKETLVMCVSECACEVPEDTGGRRRNVLKEDLGADGLAPSLCW